MSMAKTPQEFIEQSIKELSLDGLNAHYFRLGAESICKYFHLED